jgi:D-alanyl-lipoteichoic acid acyltransferase DltB (MBOAT superfamily)
MNRNLLLIAGTFAASLFLFSYLQRVCLSDRGNRLVPAIDELVPVSLLPVKENASREKIKPDKSSNYLDAGKEKARLKNFFRKLKSLEEGKTDTVRVLHFGDSLLWGDNLSCRLKMNFQNEFRDGGRGLIPAVQFPETRFKDLVNSTAASEFRTFNLKHNVVQEGKIRLRPETRPDLGFTGESSRPISLDSTIRFSQEEEGKKWQRAKIFLRSPGREKRELFAYRINVRHDSGELAEDIQVPPDTSRVISFDIPPSSGIEIDFRGSSSPLPYIDAVNLETGTGLVYNTVIKMGIHMTWLSAIPGKNFSFALKQVNPDLMIFQFGINESATMRYFHGFTPDIYREDLRRFLTQLKEMMPHTDILLFGPLERQKKIAGRLSPMKEVLQIREIQREEADRLGIAFFDSYGILGGEGHMKDLVDRNLAMDDYTHLTVRGGDYVADIFYHSLTGSYREFCGDEAERKKLEDLRIKKEKNIAIQFNSSSYAYFLMIIIFLSLAFSRMPGFRIFILLLASYYFYATWKLWPLILIISSTLVDYFCGIRIQKMRRKLKRGTLYLVLSLTVNLGLLIVFKYFDFLSNLLEKVIQNAGLAVEFPVMDLVLPVGISFYTFQTLSYTIDVWRGQMKAERNFYKFALYVSFFPQLVAGPIVRAKDFLTRLNSDNTHFRVDHEKVSAALFLILTGLVKKIGADWLAVNIIDRVYDNPGMFTSAETLTAVYAYGLQIYGDFSGYTDIALGSAMLLGYNLTENFNRPYASISITDFWRRWHISMGSWFRDYLYISLGGNRKRVYYNLFITMFLCGLWHGAGINFILWGVYHGVFLMLERYFNISSMPAKGMPVLFRKLITFHIVLFGWIIFRAVSWENFMGIMNSLSAMDFNARNLDPLLLSTILLFYIYHLTPVGWKFAAGRFWERLAPPVQGFATALVFLFLYNITISDVRPFIYFQF